MQIANYSVKIERKKMKYLRLRLSSDGEFSVSAPLRVSDKKIHEFITANLEWMQKAYTKWELNQQKKLKSEQAREQGIADGIIRVQTKAEFEQETLKMADYWQDVIGVEYERIRFRQMKTRWGVCNVKTKIITINTNLIDFPTECLEYVVVHELAHLLYAGHGRDFWAVVSKHLPNYKTLRAMLK